MQCIVFLALKTGLPSLLLSVSHSLGTSNPPCSSAQYSHLDPPDSESFCLQTLFDFVHLRRSKTSIDICCG
ncbi:hypothetical protein AKJ16_DCAP22091 [Drosera capensis]